MKQTFLFSLSFFLRLPLAFYRLLYSVMLSLLLPISHRIPPISPPLSNLHRHLLASELPHLLLLLLLPLLPLSSLPALLSAFRLPLLLLFLLSLQEMLLLQHVKSFLYSSVIVIKSIFNIRLHFLINYPYHQLIYFHLPVRFMTFIDYNLFIFCICLHTKARIMIYSWLSISKIVSE